MNDKKLFEEKQYLGYNKYALMRQLVLAIFCFIAYQITDKSLQDIFFVLGMALLVASIVLLFILHIHTTIYENCIIINGLWTSRIVKINMDDVVSIEKTIYSKYSLNSPAYNVHTNTTIKFFSGGHNEAIKLIDKAGTTYLIGSQKSEIICNIVGDIISKRK